VRVRHGAHVESEQRGVSPDEGDFPNVLA
jgi:hypothetical protein